ncbi:MAG: PEP-CTERM sorting domain-containing protein [Smithellaceae bacterium]
MKKISAILAMMAFMILAGSALAATQTFSTSQGGSLEHGKDYIWQLNTTLLDSDETIVSAQLQILGLNNSPEPDSDYLNIYLLNNPYYYNYRNLPPWSDNEFLTQFSDTNWTGSVRINNPAEDFIYILDAQDIAYLTNALLDGQFAIGFDPNCHYDYTRITFAFETEKTPAQAPEPASMLLFGLGLLGLAGFARRLKK